MNFVNRIPFAVGSIVCLGLAATQVYTGLGLGGIDTYCVNNVKWYAQKVFLEKSAETDQFLQWAIKGNCEKLDGEFPPETLRWAFISLCALGALGFARMALAGLEFRSRFVDGFVVRLRGLPAAAPLPNADQV